MNYKSFLDFHELFFENILKIANSFSCYQLTKFNWMAGLDKNENIMGSRQKFKKCYVLEMWLWLVNR